MILGMTLYPFCQIFENSLELLCLVCVLFMVFSVYPRYFYNYMMIMIMLVIHAMIMFWGALCLFLVLSLFIRRVRVIDGARIVFVYVSKVLGYMNSFGYVLFLLDLVGRRQMVTELSVRLLYGFCVIPLARIRSRSHMILGPWIWAGYSPHLK
jgi:hypothetical protein